MLRVLFALAVPLLCTALTARAADPDKLPFGEDIKGEHTVDTKVEFNDFYNVSYPNGVVVQHRLTNAAGTAKYQATFTLALEEDKDYTVTATVKGNGRSVCVVLVDPSGEAFGGTLLKATSVKETFKKVNATGTYKLIVASDKIGGFTVKVTGPPGAKPDLAALEAKRKRLQAELDELNAQIEALKKKK
jgi:hypothetical protein